MPKSLGTLIRAGLDGLEKGGEGWLNEFEKGVEKNWPEKISIHDPHKGGVLWVSNREQEVLALASVSQGKVPKKNVDKDKRLTGEVLLSRAMFNSRFIRTNKRRYRFISFEAPLMRKKEGKGSRAVACDLIALSGGNKPRLVAVEVKCREGEATNLDYALLEARYYGLCLNQAMKEEHRGDLKQEIACCLRRYHDHHEPGLDQLDLTIEFAVAAPVSYFRDQLRGKSSRLKSILESFKSTPSPKFAGFWVLPGEQCLEERICNNQITIWPDAGKSTADVWLPVLLQQNAEACTKLESLQKHLHI